MKINDELKKYIEENILPEYNKNERAHGIEHIKYVIDRSFDLIAQNNLNLNNDMVYTIAAFHDIGHHIDSKTHEIISAEIMIQDKNLHQFFSDKELITIKEAIEDHRASKKSEPRSIYGKLVSSADRNDSVEQCLRRTYTYGKKIDPKADDETLFLRAFDVLTQKFGVGGYAKFYFKDDLYEQFLQELRKLLQDKKKFCETQRKYIEKLKNQGEL